uniref:Heat shock protein 70, conserved site-containing protein n=1 Tax=Tanacetum cinerariifolium TaxID=118510 RepID=A0A6L2LDC3_TANCI|nr:heat shock protein 70, conserved site-containing protein [Tanacetum cinerariifolium]
MNSLLTTIRARVFNGFWVYTPYLQPHQPELFNGKVLYQQLNPDVAVTHGAGILAANLSGMGDESTKSLVLIDVTPMSFGLGDNRDVMKVVIPRNSPLPMKKEPVVTTSHDYQRAFLWLPEEMLSQSYATRYVNRILNISARETTTGKSNAVRVTNIDSVSTKEIKKMIKDPGRYKIEDEVHMNKRLQKAKSKLTSTKDRPKDESTIELRSYPDQGNRITLSCVAFYDTKRFVGDAAKNQAAWNPTNTIFGIIEVKATGGDTHLGGEDFDNRMVNHFFQEFKRKHKEDIHNSLKALDFSAKFMRAKFEEVNMDLLKKCMEHVEMCLRDANMSKDSIDEVILLNPGEAVAHGAGILAANLIGMSDEATIHILGTKRSLETREEACVERSTERGSNDTEELVNVLTSLDAANILTSGVQVISVPPAAKVSTVGIPTGSGLVPTASPIFTTASVVTPYSRRKGKEKMVESYTPKKKKLQEHIDVQVAREMEEQMAREYQRRNAQIAKDAEIARIHAEEELQMLIDGLDRNNEVIAWHLYEYEQAAAELTTGEKIELINELMKYQDHHAKILKYQAQQSKPLSKKQQREFYMSVLKSHSGWKTKHFKGMTLEEIKEKFIPVWKQIEDFVPMDSKEKRERVKRKGLRLEQESAKKMKTSEEVSKEDLKEMMQLVPVEDVYVEALQVKHPIIDWEIHSEEQRNYWKIIRLGGSTVVYQFFMNMLKHFDREDLIQLWTLVKETLSIRQDTSDKEKELYVKLKILFEPDVEDQLWTHTQALMHDPVEWKLYDSCGVQHVLTRDQEIFMLVEKDYPLRKG